MALSESYVGPNVRWAMLKEDYPAATHVEEWLTNIDVCDVPADFRPKGAGARGVCRCVIDFGPAADRPPVTAYRFPDVKGVAQAKSDTSYDPIGWEALSTKTLGRALKEAGYPGDANDIKLLLLWRRRMAEIGGHGSDDAVIDAAARPNADDVEPEGPAEAQAVTQPPRPPQEAAQPAQSPATSTVAGDSDLQARLRALSAENRAKLDKFMSDRGWAATILAGAGGPGNTARAFLASLEKAEGRTWPPGSAQAGEAAPWDKPPVETVATVAAELDTWDPESRRQFDMLLEANRIPTSPLHWDHDQLAKAMELLERFNADPAA